MRSEILKERKFQVISGAIWVAFYLMIFVIVGISQPVQETFTGTVVSYGSGFSTRTRVSPFTLRLTGETSDSEAQRFLARLQSGGQDDLLEAIRDEDLGRLSVNASLGRTINVVRRSIVDGRERIYIVFERWMQFAEIRGGYRSRDYPFGFMELYIDPRTGRGEGTYIAAAKIRWKRDGDGGHQVEVEDFATFPARLMNVRSNRRIR